VLLAAVQSRRSPISADVVDGGGIPLKTIGTTALLWGLVVCFLLGAIVTYLFRIETAGVNLEHVGK
jgi:hypothetical protein